MLFEYFLLWICKIKDIANFFFHRQRNTREGVRGVAGVALATPFFRFYFIKLSKKILKIVLNILLLLSLYDIHIFIYSYII